MKLDLGWGDDQPKPRPRPLPTRKPTSPMPAWAKPVFWTLMIAFVFVVGLSIGDNAGKGLAEDALKDKQAAEVSAEAYKGERDDWETSATVLTQRVDDLESDLTSATTAAEHWRERAEDASATAAAIRDDNTALKAEVARLQQMKRTVPATSSVKQASSTTSSTAGWQTAKVSWYGPGFYGNTMAGGGVLTTSSMVVAHRTMAFGTRIEFRYKGRTCIAVVNDRGPFIAGRTFDLGPGTAKALGFSGVGTVEWRVV